ncbi:MAG: hypothetical protein ABSC23_21975 [Bryobacteraceae bacterium]
MRRPMVGFSLAGWFPFDEFAACRAWASADYLTPDMIDPEAFLPDHVRMLREGEWMDDDMIRGACPGQVAIPWLPGMLGCRMRILPHSVVGEERHLDWGEALQVRLDRQNPWRRKYLEFADALVRVSAGSFPVSHAAELGPTDLLAVLRSHTQSVWDLADEPEKSRQLLELTGEIFRALTEELWMRLPLFHGGYFDAQYSLWAPGPIVRLQEDATALYSPAYYRALVQPVDRKVAAHFANSFIHLHSTSMFLLDAFLECEGIRCFEVNRDALGPPVREMAGHFRKVQRAAKPLLIRGSFEPDEMRCLIDSLDPRGLFLNIMVRDRKEVEALRPLVGM